MKQTEPYFRVLEYITITKDPRTDLVVAIGGTDEGAAILQHTGGFFSAPGPRGDYHRLPHGLPIKQQRLQGPAPSEKLDPIGRLGDTADSISMAAHAILQARNHAAHQAPQPATTPPPNRGSAATPRRRR